MEKLYVVTRADLEPGLMLAQVAHAVSEFAFSYPDKHRAWHRNGKNIAVLAARDLEHISGMLALLEDSHALECAAFFESDLSDELTAFAVSDAAARLLSCLPLALRRRDLRAA